MTKKNINANLNVSFFLSISNLSPFQRLNKIKHVIHEYRSL